MNKDVLQVENIKIKEQNLILHPFKSIYWEEENALIISDLHLGKAGHFRKSGIPIPKSIHQNDHQRLKYLISEFNPDQVIILGDLFHSVMNDEWFVFEKFISGYSSTKFILVKGNHDILTHEQYQIFDKSVDELVIPPFRFTHMPEEKANKMYNFSGHIHPSVVIRGKGRQSVKLSCFYFSKNFAVLPSFGNFTGSHKISINIGDFIYLIVDNVVIPYQNFISQNQ